MTPGRIDRWRVELSSGAARDLRRLPADERARILQAVDKLADGPYQKDSSKLAGRPEWRFRIGARRVLFLVDFQRHSITVVGIGSRGDVYKHD